MRSKFILLAVFFFFTAIISQAQQPKKMYLSQWKKIDSLIEKSGLLKTALKEVNLIYESAKKEKNDVQVIKALVYRMNINDQLSEEGKYENISMLEKEITASSEPATSILRSIAGRSYWHYLQLNRWQFYNRSRITDNKSDDIATWDISQLHAKITGHYVGSIQNKKLLQGLKLEGFEPIIIKGNTRQLRPKVYDLLAHEALDYFRNDERYVTRPAYAFVISDSMAFADAAEFVSYKFPTTDISSLHYKALQVYQDLIRFHLADGSSQALLDADINRLRFVNNFGTHPDKNDLFRRALENIVEKHARTGGIADAMYLLAEWFSNRGNQYDPLGDTSGRYELLRAKEWCERAIKTKTNSEGKTQASRLLNEIVKKEISLVTENVNVPGEAFRMLINYKNAPVAYFRLIKSNPDRRASILEQSWEDSSWKKLISASPLRQFQYHLPETKDHQHHRVEAKVDGLASGEYALLVSTEKDFPLQKGSLGVVYFYVSNIAYIRNDNQYFFVNRETGKPLPAAIVQIWQQQYNYRSKKQEYVRSKQYTSDKNGYLEIEKNKEDNNRNNFRLDIRFGKDRLYLDDQHGYMHSYEDTETNTDHSYLFTDRSLYRPGQMVHFKGILVNRTTKNYEQKIITGRKSVIRLINANGDVADSMTLTSNEFGSYHGTFTLPANVMNGQFRIVDSKTESGVDIQVEEYKRPKFYTQIAQPKGHFRLGDTIEVIASAIAYAGNNISGATVSYRVSRRAEIPLWVRGGDYTKIWPPYPQDNMEIAHGTGTTDANGKFAIKFPAIADKNIPEKMRPVFHYYVTADVTDINGETRSGNISVPVGYDALKLRISIADIERVDSLKTIQIHTTNFVDSFESSKVTLNIYPLTAPPRIFRQRYWSQPDQFILSRDEYYKTFPYDLYADETDFSKWPKGNISFSESFTSVQNRPTDIAKAKLKPGWYLFEAVSTDRFNNQVKDLKYVQLIRDKYLSPIGTIGIVANNDILETGDTLKYKMLSNLDSLTALHEFITRNDTTREMLVDGRIQRSVKISDKEKGGMVVRVAVVKNNRVYAQSSTYSVIMTDKNLKIDFLSFRDKTLPGSKETWKVKISGYKGEKVAAELLTAMYDASLDQFLPHQWQWPGLWWHMSYGSLWNGNNNFTQTESIQKYIPLPQEKDFVKVYDQLQGPAAGGVRNMTSRDVRVRGMTASAPVMEMAKNQAAESAEELVDASNAVQDGAGQKSDPPTIQPRKNFNETAFFFPALYTDSSGNIEFSFSAPEALTAWKWMLLAHTKDLASASAQKEMITQKQLMVQPNVPRFLREGDHFNFTSKISNLSGKSIKGKATLELVDAESGEMVDGIFSNTSPTQFFSAAAGESVAVNFRVAVPFQYSKPVTWRIIAQTDQQNGSLSDGEEAMLPVITNRMLITESLPLAIRGTGTKSFTFEKLLKSDQNKSLQHHGITVEFTSNPAWFAVQSLPFLSEQTHENAEQVFNRYYANALAAMLANHSPRLKSIVAKWSTGDSSAFLSNLHKNEELKTILLQETPWVLQAKTEAQQKKNIALLFDMVRMSSELKNSLSKLAQMQSEGGGFVWFTGGPEDRYMTQYILSGIGHLIKLGAIQPKQNEPVRAIMEKGISYLDQQIRKDHDQILKQKTKSTNDDISSIAIQYLYMRSFFPDIAVPGEVFPAYNYFRNQSKKGWLKHTTLLRGMIALALNRTGEKMQAEKIMASLQETAIRHKEMGMYWKDMSGGYYWHQAPVETQAVMIEAFSEIKKDTVSADDMKTWLLKNKQTNGWRTSRATADACYALLLQGSNWLQDDVTVQVKLGNKIITPTKEEAGSGYFKNSLPADQVKSSMGNVSIDIKNAGSKGSSRPAWGAVYWQYFDDLNNITSAGGSLSLNKKLFIIRNTDRGPELQALSDQNIIKVGDKIKVRMEIRTDRDLEYVHLKDLRAAGLEPVNVLSGYKWSSGLGYYESTKDASTSFFFSFLPKGVHVFEYELFASQSGKFSNGVTTIECMYAPEFRSHSEGIQLNVDRQ